jgi:hypothetical protein
LLDRSGLEVLLVPHDEIHGFVLLSVVENKMLLFDLRVHDSAFVRVLVDVVWTVPSGGDLVQLYVDRELSVALRGLVRAVDHREGRILRVGVAHLAPVKRAEILEGSLVSWELAEQAASLRILASVLPLIQLIPEAEGSAGSDARRRVIHAAPPIPHAPQLAALE